MHAKLKEKIETEAKEIDTEKAYCESLDDCFSFKTVGGLFEYMQPSAVLREMDPTGYRCGLLDYIDGQDEWASIDNGETYYDRDELEDLRDELADEIEAQADDDEDEELRKEAEEIRQEEF